MQANHKRCCNLSNNKLQLDKSQLGLAQNGRAISSLGMHADIEALDGTQHRCDIRRTLPSLVNCDSVILRSSIAIHEKMPCIVESVHNSTSVLMRQDFYEGLKSSFVLILIKSLLFYRFFLNFHFKTSIVICL